MTLYSKVIWTAYHAFLCIRPRYLLWKHYSIWRNVSAKLENIQVAIYRRNAFKDWELLTVSNLLNSDILLLQPSLVMTTVPQYFSMHPSINCSFLEVGRDISASLTSDRGKSFSPSKHTSQLLRPLHWILPRTILLRAQLKAIWR